MRLASATPVMALQRIVIVVAAVAALALVLLVPRFFEEADDASVPGDPAA